MNAPELTMMLRKMRACDEAMYWQTGKSLEEIWNTCERGDWMLWLFSRVYKGDDTLLYLIAGHCANTVRHLMKDERSSAAVDAAIAYGECRIEKDELRKAAAAAAAAAYADAADAAAVAAAAAYAADAADAADAAAVADAAAADAAAAAAVADAADAAAVADAAAADAAAAAAVADAAAAVADARSLNRKQTADIVRQFVSIELITQCVYEYH